jgi:hypothetical protein
LNQGEGTIPVLLIEHRPELVEVGRRPLLEFARRRVIALREERSGEDEKTGEEKSGG